MPDQQGELRLGVIGTGCIGMEHIRNALLLPSVRVVAIADPHEPSRQTALAELQHAGVREVIALERDAEMLQLSDVDAVLVCTPNDTHHAVMRQVLASGKHCLVEKPLCTLISHCAETVALARQPGGFGGTAPLLWCGMEYRYIPAIARLIQEADQGLIGDLRMLSIREHRFPFLKKVGNWNRTNERTGGTLVEKCVHFFDLMRRILRSEPRRIFASGGQEVNHKSVDSDVLDSAYVIVDFQSGARAMLELCMFAEASKHQEEVSLVGTRGKLEAFAPSHGTKQDDESEVNFRRCLRSAKFIAEYEERARPPADLECGTIVEAHEKIDARLMQAGDHAGSTYYELHRFVDAALSAGAKPDVTLEDGALAVMMGVGAHESMATGLPVLWSDLVERYAHSGGAVDEPA